MSALPVDLLALSDPHYGYGRGWVVDVLDDAVITGPNSPGKFAIMQFLTSSGSRILAES
jgi:hypothetical protein